MKYFKKTMHQGASPSVFRNTAHLRKNPTRAEEILWKRLCNNQIENTHFSRQHPFLKYVSDFYANSIKLVIELDGGIHDDKSVKFTDADSEYNLNLNKLNILRYSNEDVYNYEDALVEDIRLMVIELRTMKRKK